MLGVLKQNSDSYHDVVGVERVQVQVKNVFEVRIVVVELVVGDGGLGVRLLNGSRRKIKTFSQTHIRTA